jgi:hypothetical protein
VPVIEVVLLKDDVVPFAGFIQRLLDIPGYLGTLVKICVVDRGISSEVEI